MVNLLVVTVPEIRVSVLGSSFLTLIVIETSIHCFFVFNCDWSQLLLEIVVHISPIYAIFCSVVLL